MKSHRLTFRVLRIIAATIVASSSFVAEMPRHPVAATPDGGRYKMNAAHSRFMAHAFAAGFLKRFGHDHNFAIRDFAGEVRATPGGREPGSLHMTIKANSLTLTDDVSAGDRQKIEHDMRTKVLEVAKYPEITFQSTKVFLVNVLGKDQYQVNIVGKLTLHGMTRRQIIPARVTLQGNSLHARGAFAIQQTDYNIRPISVAAGAITVKDEMNLDFDIEADRQAG
jgi:polyisoprenoid-binding protein YceI